MVKKFDKLGEFAFIREQLSWLGLDDTFDKDNLLEDVVPQEKVERLKDYLHRILNQKLFAEDQQLLNDAIMNELILNKVNYRTKKMKPTTISKILRDDLNFKYQIETAREWNRKSEHHSQTYWMVTNI